MGIDIQGWVECLTQLVPQAGGAPVWVGMTRVGGVMRRDYQALAALNLARGLIEASSGPAAVQTPVELLSDAARDDLSGFPAGHATTLAWPDLRRIDWDAPAAPEYVGEPVAVNPAWQRLRESGAAPGAPLPPRLIRQPRRLLTRGDGLGPDGRFVLSIMDRYAAYYGDEAVRLVYWLD